MIGAHSKPDAVYVKIFTCRRKKFHETIVLCTGPLIKSYMRIFIDLEFAKDNKENVKEGIPILFKQKQLDKKLISLSKIHHMIQN